MFLGVSGVNQHRSQGYHQIFMSHLNSLAALLSICILGLAFSHQAHADFTIFSKEVDVRFDAGYMYDDNVTRAKKGVDQLADRSYSANLSGVMFLPFTPHTRGLFTLSAGGEKFSEYKALSRFTGSAQGELQYRNSAEFSTPTFAVFIKTFAEQYESILRSGSRYSAGLSIRQPVTDRINLFAAIARNQRYAKSAVFNIMENSARVNIDYGLSSRGTVYLGTEYRSGDTVSTAQPSLENIDIADVFAQDDTYPSGLLYSYRFKGSTFISTLGYNYGLSSRHSLDISWRMIESKANERPSYATSPSSYIVNQYSLVYLMSF
jgi:hypothetical protein